MPLIEVEPDVLLDTATGTRIVRDPDNDRVVTYPVGSPPLFFRGRAWPAIRAHAAEAPSLARRAATGLEDLCGRIAAIERRLESLEREAPDRDGVEAPAPRLGRGEMPAAAVDPGAVREAVGRITDGFDGRGDGWHARVAIRERMKREDGDRAGQWDRARAEWLASELERFARAVAGPREGCERCEGVGAVVGEVS